MCNSQHPTGTSFSNEMNRYDYLVGCAAHFTPSTQCVSAEAERPPGLAHCFPDSASAQD